MNTYAYPVAAAVLTFVLVSYARKKKVNDLDQNALYTAAAVLLSGSLYVHYGMKKSAVAVNSPNSIEPVKAPNTFADTSVFGETPL